MEPSQIIRPIRTGSQQLGAAVTSARACCIAVASSTINQTFQVMIATACTAPEMQKHSWSTEEEQSRHSRLGTTRNTLAVSSPDHGRQAVARDGSCNGTTRLPTQTAASA